MAKVCSAEGCGKAHNSRGFCIMHYRRWQRHGDLYQTLNGESIAFIDSAVASKTDYCIIWPFGEAKGYGRVTHGGKREYVSRLVLEQTVGPAPHPKMHAAHLADICHNPLCCNPRHLRWATAKDNAADKLIDGTDNRGEKHGNAKLTEGEVLSIRESSRLTSEIAERFGVSTTTVYRVKNRTNWGWLI